MPFKTRQQKIAAQKRRYDYLADIFSYGGKDKGLEKQAPQESSRTEVKVEDYGYIGKDLIKIALLATLVIFGQLALTFLL